jgi:hypothetical protein
MKKFSIRPFGFKGRIFTRRREAELLVEQVVKAGGKACWIPWGKRFKVYYDKNL